MHKILMTVAVITTLFVGAGAATLLLAVFSAVVGSTSRSGKQRLLEAPVPVSSQR